MQLGQAIAYRMNCETFVVSLLFMSLFNKIQRYEAEDSMMLMCIKQVFVHGITMMPHGNKTANGWILANVCKDNTVFWLYTSGCSVVGLIIGLLMMFGVCRMKKKGSSSKCELRSSRGTFYFEEHMDLARKPTEYNATSNFYIHDINAESSTNSEERVKNENREIKRPVRPSKPPLPETDESDDELAEGDDYIKMMQPKGSVYREMSRRGTPAVQFENSAMY